MCRRRAWPRLDAGQAARRRGEVGSGHLLGVRRHPWVRRGLGVPPWLGPITGSTPTVEPRRPLSRPAFGRREEAPGAKGKKEREKGVGRRVEKKGKEGPVQGAQCEREGVDRRVVRKV